MKQNQNVRQNRPSKPNQNNNNPKRNSKGRPNNNNRSPQASAPNRQVDSRGPAGTLRGNAKQLYEKYRILAQERRASDRLDSESLSQHADHYYRIYAESEASEAASQVVREEAQAQKAQEEAERRVNSVTPDPRPVDGVGNDSDSAAPKKPKRVQKPSGEPVFATEGTLNTAHEAPLKSEKAKPENAKPQRAPDAEADLTLDLGLPQGQPEAIPDAAPEEPKKRRGRPAKPKPPETVADAAPLAAPEAPTDTPFPAPEPFLTVPEKTKIVRRPRKKMVSKPGETTDVKPE